MPDTPRPPRRFPPLILHSVSMSQLPRGQPLDAPFPGAPALTTANIPTVFTPPDSRRPNRAPNAAAGGLGWQRPHPDRTDHRLVPPSTLHPPDAEPVDGEPDTRLPATRYRIGAASRGGRRPGPIPNPGLALRQRDSFTSALGLIRNLSEISRIQTAHGVAPQPATIAAATPTPAPVVASADAQQADPQQAQPQQADTQLADAQQADARQSDTHAGDRRDLPADREAANLCRQDPVLGPRDANPGPTPLRTADAQD